MPIDLATLDPIIQGWAANRLAGGPMSILAAHSSAGGTQWTWEMRHANQGPGPSVVVVDVGGNAAQATHLRVAGSINTTDAALIDAARQATYELWLTILEAITCHDGLTVIVETNGPSSQAAAQWDADLLDVNGARLTGDEAAIELSRIIRGSNAARACIGAWPQSDQDVLRARLAPAQGPIPAKPFRRPCDLLPAPGGIRDPLGITLLGCLQWNGQIVT